MSYEPFRVAEEEETLAVSLPDPLEAVRYFRYRRLPAKTSDWLYIPGHSFPEELLPVEVLSPGVTVLHGPEVLILSQSAAMLATIFRTPSTHALDEAIDKARAQLLAFKEDWDDAGGKPYQAATIDRASGLLKRLFAVTLTRGFELPLPAIRPADAGSIDLYWSDSNRTLLINVPEDPRLPATLSGRGGSVDTVAGRLNLDEGRISHLASWLSE